LNWLEAGTGGFVLLSLRKALILTLEYVLPLNGALHAGDVTLAV